MCEYTHVEREKPKRPQLQKIKKMQYSKSSSAPAWFKSDDSKIYASATSGSSPFNEWYEFDDRADAIKLINSAFDSQSFIDHFQAAQGEYYDAEELFSLLTKQFGEDHDFSEVIDDADLSSLTPAGIGEMVEAESRF